MAFFNALRCAGVLKLVCSLTDLAHVLHHPILPTLSERQLLSLFQLVSNLWQPIWTWTHQNWCWYWRWIGCARALHACVSASTYTTILSGALVGSIDFMLLTPFSASVLTQPATATTTAYLPTTEYCYVPPTTLLVQLLLLGLSARKLPFANGGGDSSIASVS